MDIEIVGRLLSTCPRMTTTRTGPDPGGRRTPSGGRTTSRWKANYPPTWTVYLRNTENPVHPAIGRYHPFDGDGMIHLIGFRDGRAFYRNKFVRTDALLAEQQQGGPLWAGLAERPDKAKRPGWGPGTCSRTPRAPTSSCTTGSR